LAIAAAIDDRLYSASPQGDQLIGGVRLAGRPQRATVRETQWRFPQLHHVCRHLAYAPAFVDRKGASGLCFVEVDRSLGEPGDLEHRVR
jgi:hypothetical protein